MNYLHIYLYLFLSSSCLLAQFPPPAGQPGSTALHKDSLQWAAWATSCTVERGYQNISNSTLGWASVGTAQDATGPAGGGSVLSLGDGGVATLGFNVLIRNGQGPDFAVFENAFSDSFLELAFVEVSSDGQHFVRFPAISNTDTSTQVAGFGAIDASKIHNLAGKYKANYGTPFDLEDLRDSIGIDIEQITHIRIIDVVGSIDPLYARRDSRGIIINDPWPTPFDSGGFDLDAIGVIHAAALSQQQITHSQGFNFFPNPLPKGTELQLDFDADELMVELYDLLGQPLWGGILQRGEKIPQLQNLEAGVYIIRANRESRLLTVF